VDSPPASGTDADEPVLISALEHYSYCARQCGLIHLEQTFDENIYTVRGHLAHERVDEFDHEEQAGVRVERALPLWSRRLGLVGRADVVEFRDGTAYPVEYKVGARRKWGHEDLQLCAQAICLEEMLGGKVPFGSIYYVASRRRRELEFTLTLRAEVERITTLVRQMLAGQRLPTALLDDPRCPPCSLYDSCLPELTGNPGRVRALQASLFEIHDP
jgi:CRISPR-associated exonuclease Cas4